MCQNLLTRSPPKDIFVTSTLCIYNGTSYSVEAHETWEELCGERCLTETMVGRFLGEEELRAWCALWIHHFTQRWRCSAQIFISQFLLLSVLSQAFWTSHSKWQLHTHVPSDCLWVGKAVLLSPSDSFPHGEGIFSQPGEHRCSFHFCVRQVPYTR